MPHTPIIGTLGYILSPEKDQVLMVHRIGREDDLFLGKYNGLGGKMEAGEDVLSCMKREIFEEAGIIAEELHLRGTVNWTGFGKNGEDWLGFIFLIERFSGTPLKECAEGPLEFVPINQLHTLPMWEGDRHFLPLVFDKNQAPFHGHMPYQGGKVMGWSFERERGKHFATLSV
ncbi:NUDIX hydrolase [Estrella lausannensis]|uniref:Mutator MutT protein n=1 Tax=Estrella lausannensis TaxID=483423 RepID=A0A0H5E7V8_9BACT|nr:8-oxo-dGTP diphosphatase [Estrella lausannensis]CRX39420.1 Mutator MutT protein [Estrella lausannensis]